VSYPEDIHLTEVIMLLKDVLKKQKDFQKEITEVKEIVVDLQKRFAEVPSGGKGKKKDEVSVKL
jgi:hypothetical protein